MLSSYHQVFDFPLVKEKNIKQKRVKLHF